MCLNTYSITYLGQNKCSLSLRALSSHINFFIPITYGFWTCIQPRNDAFLASPMKLLESSWPNLVSTLYIKGKGNINCEIIIFIMSLDMHQIYKQTINRTIIDGYVSSIQILCYWWITNSRDLDRRWLIETIYYIIYLTTE